MKKNKAILISVIVGILLISGIFAVLYFSGNLQSSVNSPSGTYIQAPTFYYYECSPASQPVESTHVNLNTGSSNGWITCPSNTDTCDLWISQTEQTAWYSLNRRIVYQICHNNGNNCDNQVYTTSDYFSLSNANVPSVHISNLLITDRVYVNYQYQNLLFQWIDKGNSAEWYQTYKPFILWKVDMFGGGRTEYTSISQGCNFNSGDVGNLLNSITNSIKQINTQTSSSSTNLPFYQTRNFIGTYVPISTANVNFVTYNGQDGYCLNRQVFAITTATTNDNTYQIVDSNFNTLLANSVTCCPGETQPNQKCGDDFQWHDIATAQCSAFSPCAGADWSPDGAKQLIRYNCVNSKCVSETKQVECTSNSDCGNNQICDTSNYVCVNAGTGGVIGGGGNESNCKWYQDSYVTSQKVCSFLFFGCEEKPKSGCTTASWIFWTIIIFAVSFVIGIFILINKLMKKK